MSTKSHTKRIQSELKSAGMTFYGLTRMETAHLPNIIHDDEHIHGVVYGRQPGKIDTVMLVATNKRVIYLDCKPFYKNWDEVTYEVVAGVKVSIVRPFASVVLHTRVDEYKVKFVNIKCAEIFSSYIEKSIERRESSSNEDTPETKEKTGRAKQQYQPYRIDKHKKPLESAEEKQAEEMDDTAVLSTVNKDGNPHASIVHFEIDKDENFYFLTKNKTQKIANIQANPEVALTIHHSHSLKALYIKGVAEIVHDQKTFDAVYQRIAKVNIYREGEKLAPITSLKAGEYVVVKISPSHSQFFDYSTDAW